MLGCHYSKPAREKIRDMQAKGSSDDAIVAEFVRSEGRRALVVPPAEGFFHLAWWMPPFAVALGLVMIYFWIRRMRQPQTAPIPGMDPKVLERYRESIERDMASLE
jgi:cytochrome c-type biogenesis protein CcmH/NrfF